jgi:small-conductance mechanosensitive channel
MKELQTYWESIWSVISTPLFKVGDSTITISSVLIAFIILLFSLYLAKMAEKVVSRSLSKRKIDRGVRGSIERFSRYTVVLIGSLVSLDTMGVSISSLAAVGAVLMVGIGFGLQNLTQNFISGIILLMERPIKNGDIIKVGDQMGRVLDIRVRSTIVLTRDDVALIVPNSLLVSEVVTNESYTEERIRIHVKVGVAYGSDTEKVCKNLLEAANECEKVLKTPPPQVVFADFGDSALNFDLRIWIGDLWTSDLIRSEIRFSIDKKFKEAGIVIAFPQMDLHFKSFESPAPLEVRTLS